MKHGRRMVDAVWRSARRAGAVRSDERGQVVLLAGVMVFVIMIMTITIFDTGKAIYNRIVVQNAVDSAADSAALWQARGCNLLQHLNNLHHEVNEKLYIAESAALVGCGVAVVGVPSEIAARPLAGTWLAPVYWAALATATVSCNACWGAPWIDWGQEQFAKLVMKTQDTIKTVFPAIAFLYANAAAKQSGADDLLGGMAEYADTVLVRLGVSSGGPDGIAATLSEALGSLPVNIYAMPLDPSSLSLHVERKKGVGLPWKWPDWQQAAAQPACQLGATLCNGDSMILMPGRIEPNKPEKWGWADEFYWGNPGFMTWIAVKRGQGELIGLGNLAWLNGGKASEADMQAEHSRTMFSGEATRGGRPLTIPAFLAIASSQVEGEPVVSKGQADAEGKITKVYFPPESSPGDAAQFLIFH